MERVMPSGKKLTDADRMSILQRHHQGMRWAEIARELALDYRTVKTVVQEAARRYYEMIRPNRLDEISDPH